MVQSGPDFNAIRISLASPEQIRIWSYGEVTKPETINYRTLRPERDGLFCERIFGPTKDWECACGKYKKIRFKGVKCERCGVEVTRTKVRRERMGHIELAAPVAHIWFSKGIPSRLGLLLDLSPRNLERVLYFAQYIVTEVNEEARQQAIDTLDQERQSEREQLEQSWDERLREARQGAEAPAEGEEGEPPPDDAKLVAQRQVEIAQLEETFQARMDILQGLRTRQLLMEARNRDMADHYPGVVKSGMGAEAILDLLRRLDLDTEREGLFVEMRSTSGQRRKKAVKRLRVVEAFRKSQCKPEWMVLTALPILPPDLRPMVQLDGGRFATSDLNDLYRRVINRNNRLRRLLDLEAPEIIVRNEKRMLQEAVDALIDNGRRGRAIAGNHNHKLKSLSDLLRGKQGRFRQNLLGKRVDYSGRSVIVAGPELRLDQCGLPKRMALELFKPFVMHRLVLSGEAHNIKSAKRTVDQVRPEVWDVLEEVIKDRPVLLNRAPTLHRLGLQAFMPVLIEGSAIQVHPLVCTAFNADFDGDQMAVHVPLSRRAVREAKQLMLATYNMLSPASGDPLVAPTLDIVMGCFYLTTEDPEAVGSGKAFASPDEARLAQELGMVGLRAPIVVLDGSGENGSTERVSTTAGRLMFQELLPPELADDPRNWNRLMDKGALKDLVTSIYHALGNVATSEVLDKIKTLGYHYATVSGITIGINDLHVPDGKAAVLENAESQVQRLEQNYQGGLVNEEERHDQTIRIWTEASEKIKTLIEEALPTFGGVALMANSGAKGNISQITQMAGIRGLMSDPKGRLIEIPVKSSFREGLSVLEYFISTHGARKGLADTALRTADSGYLTRRMIDVAQDVIALSEDCETMDGVWIRHDLTKERNNLVAPFPERLVGRVVAAPVANSETGEILVDRNETILDLPQAERLWEAGVREVLLRSVLSCEARRGICRLCYGIMPATGQLIAYREAAGIIAAQSIGEPGTQLTMRTFHTGGVAGVDITSGIPRVEELFEARVPKNLAILAEIDGVAEVSEGPEGRRIRVASVEEYREEHPLEPGHRLLVQEGDVVEPGTALALAGPAEGEASPEEGTPSLAARMPGRVQVSADRVAVVWQEQEERAYVVPPTAYVTVKNGDQVTAGQELTAGLKNPHDILRIQGKDAVQDYILEEVQRVYRSQGVSINDKHIESIVRQMLRKIRVDSQGDTAMLPGEPVDRFIFEEINRKVLSEGGEPARATPLLLGITRASLSTESFLAAASFQETTRVLTEAAINGTVDRLSGLKENVIIGRLIPTREDMTTPDEEDETELPRPERDGGELVDFFSNDPDKNDDDDLASLASLSALDLLDSEFTGGPQIFQP